MKKSKLILIISTLAIIFISIIIYIFIKTIKKDKEEVKENEEIVLNTYNNFLNNVDDFNENRKDIVNIINEFYYDSIDTNYNSNKEKFSKYDEIIKNINNNILIFDSKCNNLYKNKNINNICNSYKENYEKIVNTFINDINNYNNKLSKYNVDNNKKLELFKSDIINDYIDYNNDSVYLEKSETNA